MQARAIFEAASKVIKEGGRVEVEIMVPLVGTPQELGNQVEVIRRVGAEVQKEQGSEVDYKVGTMIEIPRAALVADEVSRQQKDRNNGQGTTQS